MALAAVSSAAITGPISWPRPKLRVSAKPSGPSGTIQRHTRPGNVNRAASSTVRSSPPAARSQRGERGQVGRRRPGAAASPAGSGSRPGWGDGPLVLQCRAGGLEARMPRRGAGPHGWRAAQRCGRPAPSISAPIIRRPIPLPLQRRIDADEPHRRPVRPEAPAHRRPGQPIAPRRRHAFSQAQHHRPIPLAMRPTEARRQRLRGRHVPPPSKRRSGSTEGVRPVGDAADTLHHPRLRLSGPVEAGETERRRVHAGPVSGDQVGRELPGARDRSQTRGR